MKKITKNDYKILGTIAIVDISTPKFPNCSMKIDTGVWWKLLGKGIGRVSCDGRYAQTNINGTVKKIHKLLTPSFKRNVDHINHDSLDNRLSNLRDVTALQNGRNHSLSAANRSGTAGVLEYKGVYGSTWRVNITNNERKRIYLGSFKTKEMAISVRKAAEVKFGYHTLHGAK